MKINCYEKKLNVLLRLSPDVEFDAIVVFAVLVVVVSVVAKNKLLRVRLVFFTIKLLSKLYVSKHGFS